MHESQNFKVAVSQSLLFYLTKSLQKELEFFLQNCGSAQVLKFWVYHNGKRAPSGAKICNFQKLAWYSPENGNAWTKTLPHHFGGVFRKVFGVRSKIWALEVPFFGTWQWALLSIALKFFCELPIPICITYFGYGIELRKKWFAEHPIAHHR